MSEFVMKHNQTFPKQRIAYANCESILFSILYLVGLISWSESQRKKRRRRGRPYSYSPTVILRCFIVRLWFRLDSNNALHEFLKSDYTHNQKIVKACGGLSQIPNRRMFDRHLNTISIDIKERIATLSNLSIQEKRIDPYIVAIDNSTLLKAKGHMWHKSSMKKRIVPRSGIDDTDARWGFSHTKGWIDIWLYITFDIKYWIYYRPLIADLTTANVYDN